MVDRVLERGEDRCLVVKAVTADEVLQDGRAIPGRPWPSALVIEAMAQAALPLAGPPGSPAGPGVIVAMDGVRVHRQVRPGERLRISSAVITRFGGMIRIACRAVSVDDGTEESVVAEGQFTLALGTLPGAGEASPGAGR